MHVYTYACVFSNSTLYLYIWGRPEVNINHKDEWPCLSRNPLSTFAEVVQVHWPSATAFRIGSMLRVLRANHAVMASSMSWTPIEGSAFCFP